MERSDNAQSPADPPADVAEPAKSLEARRDELDEFARAAAHDLHAPLRSIEAFARMASETDDRSEAGEHLDRIVGTVGRMRRLLDALLELADSGQMTLEFVPMSLEDVADAAASDVAADILDSGAAIDVGPLPSIVGDPTQLERVFANLFSNAIAYSGGKEPRIEVRAVEDEKGATVTVSDRGSGFSQEFAEAVFLPFRRLSAASGGQGIGLTICRRVIERHGGRIWAESEPGEGTWIRFFVPSDPTTAAPGR